MPETVSFSAGDNQSGAFSTSHVPDMHFAAGSQTPGQPHLAGRCDSCRTARGQPATPVSPAASAASHAHSKTSQSFPLPAVLIKSSSIVHHENETALKINTYIFERTAPKTREVVCGGFCGHFGQGEQLFASKMVLVMSISCLRPRSVLGQGQFVSKLERRAALW